MHVLGTCQAQQRCVQCHAALECLPHHACALMQSKGSLCPENDKLAGYCAERHSLFSGGGAVEAALSIYLENFATTLGSREQLAIAEVADALLVIPKCLAVNAAKDATELVRPFVLPVDRACTFAEHASPSSLGLVLLLGKLPHHACACIRCLLY